MTLGFSYDGEGCGHSDNQYVGHKPVNRSGLVPALRGSFVAIDAKPQIASVPLFDEP